jgi:hypothetical protein
VDHWSNHRLRRRLEYVATRLIELVPSSFDGRPNLESSRIRRNSLDATGCADWLVEQGLEPPVSRETFPKGKPSEYWRNPPSK